MKPKRILYYCQSLVGVGHLAASERVIAELLPHCEIDLIQGGIDTNSALTHARLRTLRLATLLHDRDSGGFFVPEEEEVDIDDVWQKRAASIEAFLRFPYNAVVVEFYPFGRRRFKAEIQGMFRAVRARCGPVPVFTCVREVLVPRALEKERRMVASVKKYIHTVFIRGDASVIAFDETFSLAHEIQDQLVYTGYIAPPPPQSRPQRQREILVSQGGGNVGRELLEAAIGAAALMPDYGFLLACGSRTPPAEIDALRASARSANVQIMPFLSGFQRQLQESALSISMGGDNTLMDLVTTRTPALAYAYQANPEQGIRIAKFAQKGFVHALAPADLPAQRLKQRIEHALHAPYPRQSIGVNGAAVTAECIRSILHHAASPRRAVESV